MAKPRQSAPLSFLALEDRSVPAGGTLDTTFGINGLTTISFPNPLVTNPAAGASATVVQADGKILVAGTAGPNMFGANAYVQGSPSPDFAVTRLNANGSIDTTFGVNGRAVIPIDIGGNDKTDIATSIGLQSNGDIIVAGSAQSGAVLPPTNSKDWAVIRLLPNGKLDTTFGTNGKEVFAFGTAGEGVDDIKIMPDDRIVLVGDVNPSTPEFIDIARLEPTGQPDTTFGNKVPQTGLSAITLTTPGPLTADVVHSVRVALEPDSSIIIAYSEPSYGDDIDIFRLTPTGELDNTFGGTNFGFANLPPLDAAGDAFGVVGDIAIQPDGKIVVGGGQIDNGNMDVIRYNADGTLDTTFGTNGLVQIPFKIGGSFTDIAEGVAIQPDGKILVGGKVQIAGGNPTIPGISATFESATFRLNSNGTLDTTYGKAGTEVYPTTAAGGVGNITGANAMALSTGGKMVLVGSNSTEMQIIQVTNSVSFNPLPPAPVPAPPPVPPASPGTTVSQFAVSGEGPRVLEYQPPNQGTNDYDTKTASNIAAQGPMSFLAIGFTGVVRSAIGDVDGDGIPDIAVITGPGTPTRWAVISGAHPNAFLINPFPAFIGDETFDGGGYITLGDLNGDGKDEIIVSADQTGGPRVSIYSYTPVGPKVSANFFGINDPNFRGGVRTAVGDVNGDGVADLAVAAGFGGGPRIAIYDGNTLFSTQTKLVNDFFAFSSTLQNGAYLAIGDVNGDGFGDLIFGAGDGGAPRVLIVSGQKLLANTASAINSPIDSFFVNGDTSSRGGVRVAVKDVDGDNKADILAASGVDEHSMVRIYLGKSVKSGEPTDFQDIDPFDIKMNDGVYVG